MDIITLDFETYYDADYTLSKMTTEEYVRDARFEVHGCALRTADRWRPWWLTDQQLREQLDIDWSKPAVLCHHAQFDGLILSHHYGIVPAFYLDTLSMARALVGVELGKSLQALAEHFALRPKTIPYELFKGKHWHELLPDIQRQVGDGACRDVDTTWDLFQILSQRFPAQEFEMVDATVRMFTNPVLEGDTDRLAEIWSDEEKRKADLLTALGVSGKDIRKDWVFAELLRAEGIEPEQKRMKPALCKACNGEGGDLGSCNDCNGTGEVERYKYAFAKTDDFMRELEDHEDEDVRLLAEAKLQQSSNITQTRTGRLGWMSTRGNMCVYLNYAGTHLWGWSGGDKVNWQNNKRGSPILGAIRAPRGYRVIVADASQVECRLLNEIAGQEDVVERFRNHEDPYVALASTFYGETIYKPKPGDPRALEMEAKRGTGKQGELSCGYGAGAATIKATAKRGSYGPPVLMSDEDSLRLRDTYRSTHPCVQHLWEDAGDILKKMHAGMELDWNVVHIKDKVMYLPGGVGINYTSLEWDDELPSFSGKSGGWKVRTRKHGFTKIYGAKLVENLIQGLRNVLIKEAWLRCKHVGLGIVSMEHDKLIAVVREHEAEEALIFIRQEMSRPPAWLPNVPLDSEGYISDTLAKPEK